MKPATDLLAHAAAPTPPATLPQRLLRQALHSQLADLACGELTVVLPHGERVLARGAAPGPQAQLVLHRWRPLLRLAAQGDLGLARAWRDGDWSTPDLVALLQFGAANDQQAGKRLQGKAWSRLLARLAHLRRGNTKRGSRENIAFHYDLGNAFYAQWLDASMLYSSALYTRPDATLEQAQAERLNRIVELVDAPQGADVLEIGCGWGALALALAQRRAARVTGLTLSTEQLAFARERALAEGCAQQLDLRLQDYRDVQGRYARIVSIEMVEAVGEAWWPTYFATLRDRLAPGGHAVLQAITIADAHFEGYRRGADFIQRYIFPGGMLPSPTALREQAARAGLVLQQELLFGDSYAATLVEWRRRFLAAWPAIEAQGFDLPFKRLWEYYLCYCEAGFRSGRVDVGLYTLRHAADAPAQGGAAPH
ncbi:cyclopropane-fatty-acyl-phospholipid synthase family protein [Pseudorhodoferax sp. Leaf274]|uniref:SAM-dependent methyltransferase n=1 Tax=Pseudorhodoferax sp. Leaf274 TaxID=1736318 RepID=UPI000703618D|nr:cyclopropane-fatty-acyl-phospholipid synthase family protein [Pseudorhodoferax sp. Leaf274]KQP35277.1 cyclopropane-fatty-acyl-phospholipid synthase [Pseudorhodoferax sp. Leaf274]